MNQESDKDHAAIRHELLEMGSDWAAAMISNDSARIGSFMADDWVIVSERGISTKTEFMSFVESGQLTHSSFEMVGDARIKVYGDTAVLTCRVVNTAHFGGQQFDADEWTSDVFVKRDGTWLCVLSHITPVKE
ncbi:MAG: nuclear transport factor 2 family protein [Pyrinomonadaceae bacterium]